MTDKKVQRVYLITDAELCSRARVLHAHGTTHQAALAATNPDLTPAWWAALLAAIEAAEQLAPAPVRQATATELRQTRNEDLAAARPLLQDVFYYAARAYPDTPDASQLFGHRLYTQARSSRTRLNDALQAAAAEVLPRRAALEAAGMPAASVTRLLALAEAAQRGRTTVQAGQGAATVATAATIRAYNALWRQLQTIRQAAGVAFRTQPATERLFHLYPPRPEGHRLTAPAATAAGPGRRVVRLHAQLSAGRALAVRVVAPGGPVRLALVATKTASAPGLLLATTLRGQPHALTTADLGAAGTHYLVLENDTAQPATLEVRVLPV